MTDPIGTAQELIARLNDEACSRDGWPDTLLFEAADALGRMTARVRELEALLSGEATVTDAALSLRTGDA